MAKEVKRISTQSYPSLAPKLSFWIKWYKNEENLSETDNLRYFITEYWSQVLSKLDPEQVYTELGCPILHYVDYFSHTNVVIAWLELYLGEKSTNSEIGFPIKKYLEDIIKESNDLGEFTSIKAAYLYKKGIKFEKLSKDKEDKNTANFIKQYAQAIDNEVKTNLQNPQLTKKKIHG